jgi:hypothetical protein
VHDSRAWFLHWALNGTREPWNSYFRERMVYFGSECNKELSLFSVAGGIVGAALIVGGVALIKKQKGWAGKLAMAGALSRFDIVDLRNGLPLPMLANAADCRRRPPRWATSWPSSAPRSTPCACARRNKPSMRAGRPSSPRPRSRSMPRSDHPLHPSGASAMPALRHALSFAAALAAAGCASAPLPAQAGSGSIDAINHTHWAINHFSVDGRNAVDIIGPYQGGGGACCFAVPAQWKPGMTVRVDWETGVAYDDDFPGFSNWPK